MKFLLTQKLFLALADACLVLLSFALAYLSRLGSFEHSAFPFAPYITLGALMTPLWIALLAWSGRYSLDEKSCKEHFRIISVASLSAVMLFVLIFFFKREIFFSRGLIFLLWAWGVFLLMGATIAEKKREKQNTKNGKGVIRTLVIGANRNAQRVIQNLLNDTSRHVPVAILAPFGSKKKEIEGIKIMGKLDALDRVIHEQNIQQIIVCDSVEHQIINLVSFAEEHALSLQISPETLGIFRQNIQPHTISGEPFLSLRHSPLFGWGQFFKRAFDKSISGLFLIVLIPVFLVQKTTTIKRLTCKKEFDQYVFENGNILASMKNVFRGDMSLVGPAPLSPQEFEDLKSQYGNAAKRRILLRPGLITPLSNNETQHEKEIEYILRWSFKNDLSIIWNFLRGR